MDLKVTADLKLAFPVRLQYVEKPDPEDAEKKVVVAEPVLWAYHIPISEAVFEANYRILAQTRFDLRYDTQLGYTSSSALRIATLTLRDAAKRDAAEHGTPDMGPAFLNELANLTTFIAPSTTPGIGFEYLPAEQAVKRGVITAGEWKEVEAFLVFFTAIYAMDPVSKREATGIGHRLAAILGGSMTSSELTDFAASLPTSTVVATSAPIPESSVPS